MDEATKQKNAIKPKKKKQIAFDKITHLYLQEKHLCAIPKLSNPQDIQNMYLYDNRIAKIENLEGLVNLKSLYLQNNRISKIENLANLRLLEKLYLGKNKIGVLEGLECIEKLEELHIEKQVLSDNAPLCFDPRSVFSLSESLQILNISHNKITSLTFLAPLNRLVILDASYNDLDDKKDLCHTLRQWLYLKEAKFLGNPISKTHRYREDIIANSYRLEVLDNKNISDLNRTFIKKFEEGRLIRGSKQCVNLANVLPELKSMNYVESLEKAASTGLFSEIRHRTNQLLPLNAFDEGDPKYLSWNLMPKRKAPAKANKPWTLRGHKLENQKTMVVSKTTIEMRKP